MASLDVNNLSDVELRSKLAECGHPVGPVTETTRKILIKKLKLLMKARNPPRSSGRSLTRFSSGDETESDTDQNGGKRNSRRVSMPPPSASYKTTRRKTYASPTPSSDLSSEPSSPRVTSSTPIAASRSAGEAQVPRFFTPSALKQTNISPPVRGISSSFYTYDYGSDSDDVDYIRHSSSNSNSSIKRRSGPTYGTLSSYRSRLNNCYGYSPYTGGSRSLFLSKERSDTKRESSKPFFSNIVDRFSRMNGGVSPHDIKEHDIDTYRTTTTTTSSLNMNIASRGLNLSSKLYREISRPFKAFYQHLKSKDASSASSQWMSFNNTNSQWLSMFMLGLFLIFFLWLALAYFRATQRPAISGRTTDYSYLCSDLVNEAKVNCLKKELPLAIQLYKQVHSELHAYGVRSVCGPSLSDGSMQKPYMTEQEVVRFLKSSPVLSQFNTTSLMRGLKNLKLLLLSNKHWGISLIQQSSDEDGSPFEPVVHGVIPSDKHIRISDVRDDVIDTGVLFMCSVVHIPWTCYLKNLLCNFASVTFTLFLFGVGVYASITGIRYYQRLRREENQQVMKMVERILDFVSDNADKASLSGVHANGSVSSLPCDYVAIRHVHDSLIQPTERQGLAGIWEKAVRFIDENESRVRKEVQQVWGEETTVWRWVGPPLNKTQTSLTADSGNTESNHLYPDLSGLKVDSKKSFDRVWQGEAFETSEGSINALPSSFTQCLKIRHMFKHDRDYGPDWVMQIRDAIVEKCEGAKIVHLSVDQDSTEGCVYVKCASQKDAGLAYRQLHGSWFDGALITVKYLRLERYHERFPDSVYATAPLRPSNNLRLSLQGAGSGA